MHVVATAGHVDHGKSTLVRALTGMEPDRWEEERRRGLTIDLGFAWTTLPSGREVAFVDVPGHERFIGNMLAGLGPAPVVCFVVAVDEGWQAQSDDHRDAVAALDISHGIVVLTRADRAPERADAVLMQVRTELAGTGLHDAPAVVVSAIDGTGLTDLRATLDNVLAQMPSPTVTGRLRLWVDRSFTVRGAGTVVTGTLGAGTITQGDRLELLGLASPRYVTVRRLESRGTPHRSLGPVDRIAVNLRAVASDEIRRGDALVTPGAWPMTSTIDVRHTAGTPLPEVPEHLTMHVGTAAVPVRLRSFNDDHARLVIERRLPLVPGDRLVLRGPGGNHIVAGAQVLDADPPALRRRGDGARRTQVLADMNPGGDITAELARRGATPEQRLRQLGLLPTTTSSPPDGTRVINDWWVHTPTYEAWQQRLRTALHELREHDPVAAGISRGAARDLLTLPDERLLDAVVADAGLKYEGGYIRLPRSRGDLGPVEASVAQVEDRLKTNPFRAPETADLTALHLGARELAAAERAGRILRVGAGIVLLPTAPALAVTELAKLEQPFTTSSARRALGTTRRVVVPLLEHLDARGWTRRLDPGHREVVPEQRNTRR